MLLTETLKVDRSRRKVPSKVKSRKKDNGKTQSMQYMMKVHNIIIVHSCCKACTCVYDVIIIRIMHITLYTLFQQDQTAPWYISVQTL